MQKTACAMHSADRPFRLAGYDAKRLRKDSLKTPKTFEFQRNMMYNEVY